MKIAIPEQMNENASQHVINEDIVSKIIPKRLRESNKGDYGKVFIISGSPGMTGSGCLAARSAMRTGAGLVYLGVPSTLAPIYSALLIEPIIIPLCDKGTGYLSRESLNQIQNRMKQATVVAAGPGMTVSNDIVGIIGNIIENSTVPLVLDADALNAISKDVAVLRKLKTDAVITPHPGEMSRLTGINIEEVQDNRIKTAREFALKWKVITVLKGAKTVIADVDGTVYINPTGNPGMATGGAGDVLTGIIAGLIGQGAKPVEAAVVGTYLHGLAGDNAAESKGEHGLIASDIVEELPYVIKKLYKKTI